MYYQWIYLSIISIDSITMKWDIKQFSNKSKNSYNQENTNNPNNALKMKFMALKTCL